MRVKRFETRSLVLLIVIGVWVGVDFDRHEWGSAAAIGAS